MSLIGRLKTPLLYSVIGAFLFWNGIELVKYLGSKTAPAKIRFQIPDTPGVFIIQNPNSPPQVTISQSFPLGTDSTTVLCALQPSKGSELAQVHPNPTPAEVARITAAYQAVSDSIFLSIHSLADSLKVALAHK